MKNATPQIDGNHHYRDEVIIF